MNRGSEVSLSIPSMLAECEARRCLAHTLDKLVTLTSRPSDLRHLRLLHLRSSITVACARVRLPVRRESEREATPRFSNGETLH